jgi:NAD(P) transhydrogenase
MTDHFELVVIGGGPAGISGAASAGFLGKRVALVERLPVLGGAGVNTGTIPSKTLRETALVLSGLRARELHGVDLALQGPATVADFGRHARNVSTGERNRSVERLAMRGVTQIAGEASFADPHTIRVRTPDGGEMLLTAERVLIATGSSPFRPPDLPFADPRVHDSDEILAIGALPKTVVVVGAGVIGSEYACTFAAIGTQVHLVDGRDTLMPFLDSEVSQAMAAAMGESGVRFHWNERVTGCDASQPGDLLVSLTSGAELRCDALLVCAGRQSNTAQLDLAAAGIAAGERGLVTVNARYQSSVPHIYAAGDVIGAPALASTSIEQARVAVADAFGSALKSDLATCLPSGIYTIPEASMAGATEAALLREGVDFVVGRARYADLPRGEIVGDKAGFLKLLFRRDDMRLLGVHIMGEQATELIHVGLMALLTESGAELFNRACFNYPTFGDLYKNATYDAIARREGAAG